ncbi:hypothetical protein PF003_g25122 [Phytophthora fragariae]|nr:hypothetical protein PF003_g25122 [Phytophthora fragariae]
MQRDEQTWRQAIADEEAASAALVQAERVLHLQLQHQRAGSPTVDDAVSEVDLRRTEYAAAVRATDEAAALYHRAHGEVIAAERDDRRADHVQRIEAVLQQARAAQQHAAATSPSTTGGEEDTARSGDSEGESSGGASERADTGRSGGSEGSSSGNASESPPLPLNRLMPMALLSPQTYGVPPSTPAPTPAEAETQTPEYQPAESDGNEENVESDGNVENVESDGDDEKEESDSNDENAESDGNDENAESDGNDENAESDGNDENAESDGNDENAESVESSEFVPSSEAEDSETES